MNEINKMKKMIKMNRITEWISQNVINGSFFSYD